MADLIPPYPLIREQLNQGRVIPFLGSGASLGIRVPGLVWDREQVDYLPTAGELARFLAQHAAFPLDTFPDVPDDVLKLFEDYVTPDLAKVAQYYNVVGGRDPLQQVLHSIFDQDYRITLLHAMLADVPAELLILTTNYDDLIERAFRAKGRAHDVVIHTTDPAIGDKLLLWRNGESEPEEVNPNKLDIDLGKVTVIYKMHGAVDRRDPDRDQYVITEDDYVEFLARMMKRKVIPSIFAEPFESRHFLFLGYGLRDWNLRVVLSRIQKNLRRPRGITSWAIQYRPSTLEQKFWQGRGVEVYDMVIEDFVNRLVSY